jgi:hypothetical protein
MHHRFFSELELHACLLRAQHTWPFQPPPYQQRTDFQLHLGKLCSVSPLHSQTHRHTTFHDIELFCTVVAQCTLAPAGTGSGVGTSPHDGHGDAVRDRSVAQPASLVLASSPRAVPDPRASAPDRLVKAGALPVWPTSPAWSSPEIPFSALVRVLRVPRTTTPCCCGGLETISAAVEALKQLVLLWRP